MLVWISRIFIVILIIGIVIGIRQLERIIYFERRIKRYTVNSNNDDISFMDRMEIKYRNFLKKYEHNGRLEKRANSYKKYITLGEEESPVFFLLHKLVIGVLFTIIVMISSLISGHFLSLVGILFSFVVGYYIYDLYLYFSLKYKRKKIKNELLRAVILLNNSFKAGKSILQAVMIASRELPKPINQEFYRIYQDMSYGISADVAFSRFSKRVGLEEATYIASSLSILNKTGGNIVSVFNTIEKTLFDRKKLENELKTSAAASNLVVKFLMVIPFVFVFVIYVISPHYFDSLFSSYLGYFLMLLMWIMFVIYIYLLNKILKVKV